MLSEQKIVFTKENLDTYLKALAKEYRKLNGKAIPAQGHPGVMNESNVNDIIQGLRNRRDKRA